MHMVKKISLLFCMTPTLFAADLFERKSSTASESAPYKRKSVAITAPTSPRTYTKMLKSPTSKYPAMVYGFLAAQPDALTKDNVNAQNEDGLTLLHLYAQNKQHAPDLGKIFSLNPGLNVQTVKGNTPLHTAVYQEELDKPFIMQLVGAKADLSARNRNGATVIQALTNNKRPCEKDRVEILGYLTKEKEQQDKEAPKQIKSFQEFMTTMFYRAPEDTFEFIEKHPEALTADNINSKNNRGETIVHLWVSSSYFGHKVPSLESLVEDRADINAQDNEGNTPLHHLFERNNLHFGLCQALVHAKADVTYKNKQGEPPRSLLGQLETHIPAEVATLQFYLTAIQEERGREKEKATAKKQKK